MINKAIEFATRAHAGQFRKGTRRPYIVHPIEVGDIVSTMTQDEEIISAAVLHDTIEDCEGVSREILAREFSERVAGIVAQESEDKTKTWMERKSATIEHIRNAPREVQMVGLADKLSNMRDIDRDYPVYGEAVGRAVVSGQVECGVLICGTGVGISIAANKVPGVRAAVCSDTTTARLVKEHNNANIIAFGARIVGIEVAKDIVKTYLDAEFQGGRHEKRIAMIHEIENKR